MDGAITLTDMTTHEKFVAVDCEVVKLRSGRYAYRAQSPGKTEYVYKFTTRANYDMYQVSRLRPAPDEVNANLFVY